MAVLSKEQIETWVREEAWPTDSYDIVSLEPSSTQARRIALLRPLLPDWFWEGEEGAAILSIGTGKAHIERKFWRKFRKIYCIDPADQTRLSLDYFPIANAAYLARSLFGVSHRTTAKYGWLGSSIHYLFGEFHGWEFMHKLAMMISDVLVVDAAVFEGESAQGQRLLNDIWANEGEAFEKYRRAQFSYASFRKCIDSMWEVVGDWSTPWIDERRTLMLRRKLPPAIQRSQLEQLQLVKASAHGSVYHTGEGYFKEISGVGSLLVYDAVSQVMGWESMVCWRVYDGDRLVGLVTRDYGDELPIRAETSEQLHLALLSWLLPLGLLPADVARQNIRICDGRPILIDIDLRAVPELDAHTALWTTGNIYKQYADLPRYLVTPEKLRGPRPDHVFIRSNAHEPVVSAAHAETNGAEVASPIDAVQPAPSL
jgi:hypothetical protein